MLSLRVLEITSQRQFISFNEAYVLGEDSWPPLLAQLTSLETFKFLDIIGRWEFGQHQVVRLWGNVCPSLKLIAFNHSEWTREEGVWLKQPISVVTSSSSTSDLML